MLQVNNVSLQYGSKKLFEDVNLKFTKGNCYGIIGANGAGKSTFLRVLSGEVESTSGAVYIDSKARMSVLKQNQGMYDEYSVMDTVIMGNKRLYDIGKEKDAIYEKPDFTDEQKAAIRDMTTVLRSIGSRSLYEELSGRYTVRYAQGCDIVSPGREGFAEAVAAAESADVVVMALGGNCGWVHVTGGEGKDRCHLGLPGEQQALLEAVAATGKPVVLILYGPGCFALPWAEEHCAAVVEAWMPGPYAGKAVADLLDGSLNPGGKLPVSVPRTIGQVPIFYNHKQGSGYMDMGGGMIFSGGYVDGEKTPLYPFGYGLSYTTFRLSDFRLASDAVPTDGGTIRLSLSVENTGDRTGDEVVQLYARFEDAFVTRPVMQLVAFRRLTLAPGEKRRVEFAVRSAQLGYYNEEMVFCVEPGRLTLMAGTASDQIVWKGQVSLTGGKVPLLGRRAYTAESAVE